MLFGGVFRQAAPSTWSTISSTFIKHPTSPFSLFSTPTSSLLRFNRRAASTRSTPGYSLATASPKIRHAVRELRNLDQGYQIFRLSYEKTYQSIEAARKKNPSEQPKLEDRVKVAAIQTKLAAHTFAHALLRRGRALEASRFVELWMERNIRIHYRTFQATFNLLCPRVDHQVDTVGPPSPVTVPPPSEVGPTCRLNPQRQGASQMFTIAALSLLRSARQGRHGRASWMYDRIIDACLLQGEVLTAALLFVALVRDWMLRMA